MAEFFADENFRLEVVEALRGLGHDVLTTVEAGLANKAVSDRAILEHAAGEGRAVLTLNRWDFVRLHRDHPEHAGIVVCTADPDISGQAARIDAAVRGHSSLKGALIRVDRPS